MTGDAADQRTTSLEITSRSGRVIVRARPGAQTEVVKGTATVSPDGTVRGRASEPIEIACPEGSDVTIGTSSGRIECHGRLGRVAATGRSAKISIEHAATVEVRTSSGDVAIGVCDGACRVAANSGDVRVERAEQLDVTLSSGDLTVGAAGDVTVRGGSSQVELRLQRAGSVDVHTQSGTVEITVPEGIDPDARVRTRSGRVRSTIDVGSDGHLAVETSSGAILIQRG